MMRRQNVLLQSIVVCLTGLALAACSSNVPKADIADNADPQQEITKLENDLRGAVLKHIDVLAPKYYTASVEALEDARYDASKGKDRKNILDDVRESRGALNKAIAESANHDALAPGLFEARLAAIKAGVFNHPNLTGELKELDKDTAKRSEDLAKASVDELGQLQNRYLSLERQSVVLNQLGPSQALVNRAKGDKAARYAPETLKKAELSYKNAELLIGSNVRNSQAFEPAVTAAVQDATLLTEVMNTIRQNDHKLPEASALQIVGQNRQIQSLQTNLTQQQAALAAQQAATDQKLAAQSTELQTKTQAMSSEIQEKDKALQAAKAKIEIQQAIEQARKQFGPNEAEAYQQGDSLLIRLKNAGFASGRTDLPPTSLALLAKVSEIAKSLNAAEIKVEGHTDSTGGATANKSISDKRADAVATYFKTNGFDAIDVEAEGFGFEKPIATNKSKEGRALNRRVDIIITPDATTPETATPETPETSAQ